MIIASDKLETKRDRVSIKEKPQAFQRNRRRILGVKLAELGYFNNSERGQFTELSFRAILKLAKKHPRGLRVRLTHPNMSEDGITKTLGRMKNLRRKGKFIIGDLHFLELAFKEPVGGGKPLGEFVFELAQEDNGLIETSFVLTRKLDYPRNADGTRKTDEETGEPEPPVWIPTALESSDVVGKGEAVHSGFLSTFDHSKGAAKATQVLNTLFSGRSEEEIRTRCLAFVDRYLSNRDGEEPDQDDPKEEESMSEKSTGVTKEEFSQMLSQSLGTIKTEILAKVDEQIKPLKESADLAAKQLEESTRAEKISALCNQFGCADKALSYITNKALSANDVKDQLFIAALTAKQNGQEDTDPGSPGGSGGAGDLSASDKLKEKLGKEWDEGAEVYKRFGLSKEKFVTDGLSSAGLVDEKVSANVAKHVEANNPLAAGLLTPVA